MPEAEKRQVPPGQPYGEAGDQQNFLAQTAVQTPSIPLPPPGQPSLVSQPRADVGPVEAPVPGATPDPEVLSTLLGPSTRPNEDVRTGIFGTASKTLTETLGEMARLSGGSPDVIALWQRAQVLGL